MCTSERVRFQIMKLLNRRKNLFKPANWKYLFLHIYTSENHKNDIGKISISILLSVLLFVSFLFPKGLFTQIILNSKSSNFHQFSFSQPNKDCQNYVLCLYVGKYKLKLKLEIIIQTESLFGYIYVCIYQEI